MQDLSSLAHGSLTMDSSMAAGNTMSVAPPFSPVGSESEATHGIPLHSRPEPDLGPNNDNQLKTGVSASPSLTLTPRTWKTVN